MKKFYILCMLAVVLIMTSCAEEKTFKKVDGTEFVAKPYGWMNKENIIEGVDYELCTDNLVLCVCFCETLAIPALLTGLELYQPVSYVESNK